MARSFYSKKSTGGRMYHLKMSKDSGPDDIFPIIALLEEDEIRKKGNGRPPGNGTGCLPIIIVIAVYFVIKLAGALM